MATIQIPGSKLFYVQMTVHTATKNTDMSLPMELKITCQMNNVNMELYIIENTKKFQLN